MGILTYRKILFYIENITTGEIIGIYDKTQDYCVGKIVFSDKQSKVNKVFFKSNKEIQEKYYENQYDFFKDSDIADSTGHN